MIVKKNNQLMTRMEKKNKTIAMSNNLARTFCSLSFVEWKIILVLFSYLNKNNSTYLKINKKEFFDALNISGKNKNKNCLLAITGLIKKTYYDLCELNNKKNSSYSGVVISGVDWSNKEEDFEVWFNPGFMPMIQKLTKNFTVIELNDAASLTSKQALLWLLYFSSFQNLKTTVSHTLTLEQIKTISGIKDDSYCEGSKFKSNLFEKYKLQKPLSDINKQKKINVTYTKVLDKNKKLHFIFTIN